LSLAIIRISHCCWGSRPGRPGPPRRPKAAHFLRTSWRCQPRTVRGLDQHPDPSCPLYSVTQRSHDRPVSHVELRPLHLTANDSQLVAKKQQLCLWVANPQAHVGNVEEEAQEGVDKREQHPRRCKRLARATPGSQPTEEYVCPSGRWRERSRSRSAMFRPQQEVATGRAAA